MQSTTQLEAHVQAWVPQDWAQQLREQAEAGDRSLSAEVRRGLRLYLRNDNAARTRSGVVSNLAEDGGEHGSG